MISDTADNKDPLSCGRQPICFYSTGETKQNKTAHD